MDTKVLTMKTRKSEKAQSVHGPFEFLPIKIPCEGNCPHMVVTDTLNCRKELEGLADMDETRGTGKCPFWPHKEQNID
jgi:hypothetical protein